MKKICLLVLLFASLILTAQTNTPSVEKSQFKFNLLLSPNFEIELGLSNKSTLAFQLGTEIGFIEDLVTDDLFLGLFPSAKVHYRYYYNFDRRVNIGKNVSKNSGNYIGLTTTYVNSNAIIIQDGVESDDNYFLGLAAMYGLQRTYGKRFNAGADFGIGYGYSDSLGSKVIPILNFSLGWIIGS